MKIFPKRFYEIFFRAARWILGIRTVPLFPGVYKVVMRVAGIIAYQIELPYKTAEDIASLVKRFLGRKNIPYKESDDGIRMTNPDREGCPCFFVAEEGVVSFYTAIRLCEREPSRWDGFIREMKNSLRAWG